MVSKKLMKTTWYPNVHQIEHSVSMNIDTGAKYDTMFPCIIHSEELAASALKTHPVNASFAESASPMCYPESSIENFFCEIRFSLSKIAIETDKLHEVKCFFMPITVAFLEDLIITDEKSGATMEAILNLEHETTNKTVYPLWSGTKLSEKYTGSATLDAKVLGLTTNQIMESVTYGLNYHYDVLQYFAIGNKYRKLTHGMKWFTLTKTNPSKTFRFNLKSKTKAINPYTGMFILCGSPPSDTHYQIPIGADTSNANQLHVTFTCRYLEYNEKFDNNKI